MSMITVWSVTVGPTLCANLKQMDWVLYYAYCSYSRGGRSGSLQCIVGLFQGEREDFGHPVKMLRVGMNEDRKLGVVTG